MGDFGTPDQMAASMQQMQQQMQQMQELQQTLTAQQLAAQQEQPVPIGERNLPRNIPATRSAIAPPPCQRADFEIKTGMINHVQRKMFHGLPAEIPMEHIEAFEEICSFTRANGVPPDYIKCMLFPFSLADKASRWLKQLPTGSQLRGSRLDQLSWDISTRKPKQLLWGTRSPPSSSSPMNLLTKIGNDSMIPSESVLITGSTMTMF